MTPDIEDLSVIVRELGKHVVQMDAVILAQARAQHHLENFIDSRLPDLTAGERQRLRSATAQNQTSLEQLEAAVQQFRETFESWPFSP